MELVYHNNKVKKQCTSSKEAKKLFGGSNELAICLMGRINLLENATTIKDIIVYKPVRFHALKDKKRKLKGTFSIDVKTRREKWRIILKPLDENKEEFDPCYIDKIAPVVEIVEIMEVSEHYE